MNIQLRFDIQRRGDAQSLLRRILGQFIASRNAGQNVKVGFPAGRSASDLIAIAFYNHEGTGGGGWGGPIPPRPFITRAMHQGRSELRTFMRAEARNIILGRITVEQSLMRLGIWGQRAIQDQIGSNMAPANSSATVALKGSNRTLVDTGRLRSSVTWTIDGGGSSSRGGGGSRGRSVQAEGNLPVYYDVAR